MAEISCRYFNGYKPCAKSQDSCSSSTCAHYKKAGIRILLIHLEALGAVVRSTSLLNAIKRKYPESHITWVTKAPADQLLKNIETIDRVLTLSNEDLLKLSVLRFDIALVVDKSLVAEGVLKQATVGQTFGFRADAFTGAIVPANPQAEELWQLGLSDNKKFFVNKKSEQQLTHEALALGEYAKDEYALQLSPTERAEAEKRRTNWSKHGLPLIGLNTGCSATLPNKKLSVENHRALIRLLQKHPKLGAHNIVLLGGREDEERNRAIAKGFTHIVQSPTQNGLRDGLTSVAACDLIVSGDSLGMHMAIALKKWTVAWFGPTVANEIELYGRGRKIQSTAPCAPCWKRDCSQTRMCYDQVDLNQIVHALEEGLQWLISSSKPLSREIFFSPSL